MENDELTAAEQLAFRDKHIQGLVKKLKEAIKDYGVEAGINKLDFTSSVSIMFSAAVTLLRGIAALAAEQGVVGFIQRDRSEVEAATEIIDLEKQFYKEIKDDDGDVHA